METNHEPKDQALENHAKKETDSPAVSPGPTEIKPEMEYVSFDDFVKMDIRIGTVKEVEPVEGTDKLLKFQIDFGQELGIRQIVSGIRQHYPDFEALIGKQLTYIVNLKPRTIRGVESQGMLMAVGDDECIFLVPDKELPAGSRIR